MHILTRLFTISVVLAATSACTLVNFQPEGQTVELRNAADVADCELLETVTEKTTDRWTPSRNDVRISKEVLDMARSKASKIGGNTVVEKTALVMGRQTFTIYRCP